MPDCLGTLANLREAMAKPLKVRLTIAEPERDLEDVARAGDPALAAARVNSVGDLWIFTDAAARGLHDR